jgi:geranylgeranyl pyrophosphate synthase
MSVHWEMITAPQPADSSSASQFGQEVTESEALLYESLNDLYAPLSNLARRHVQQVHPHLRAAIILAAGMGENETSEQRARRIAVAAALEMQSVALSIHKLLLQKTSQDMTVDKSLLGSTILSGDYCFSRAAVLATRSDSPQVVQIFAQALRTISEGYLRQLFNSTLPVIDEDYELMSAGIQAVAILARLPQAAQNTALEFARAALAYQRTGSTFPLIDLEHLTPPQQERWKAFCGWLQAAISADH